MAKIRFNKGLNMYYIGIDGGGTTTIFRLYDQDKKFIQEVVQPTSHYGQVGFDGMEEVLNIGLQQVLKGFEEKPVVIGFGLAGYGAVLSIREQIEAVVKRVASQHTYHIYNDAQIAVAGALNGQDGVVMIAGTGSIAYARYKGEWLRAGGWGYLIDDGGSGFDVGKEGLRAFARMAEGFIQKDALFDVIMDELLLHEPMDLIKHMYQNPNNSRTLVASMGQYVGIAASRGSTAAQSILAHAAKQHAMFIQSLLDQTDQQLPVSYIGGVFKAGEFVLGPLKSYLNKDIASPQHDPCMGAVLLIEASQ